MPRLVWTKIASELSRQYVESGKCKICGRDIEKAENRFKELSNIYKHFREYHPDIIEEVKGKLSE